MPGTETALEELLCRIFGDLIAEGSVTKIADDLYIGGRTPESVFEVWRKVLLLLRENGLRLSASKTVVCPSSVSILGPSRVRLRVIFGPSRVHSGLIQSLSKVS